MNSTLTPAKSKIIHAWFRWTLHEEHGYFGWQMDNQPDFTPVTGIAHDLLEHDPSVQHELDSPMELLALGAYVYIRLEDDRSRRLNREPVFGDEYWRIGSTVDEFMHARSNYLPSILPKPEKIKILPLIAKSKQHFDENVTFIKEDYKRYYDEDDIRLIDWETFALWLTKGYCLAKARYAGIPRDSLCQFFHQINRILDKINPEDEELLPLEAPAIEVTLDPHNLTGEIQYFPNGMTEFDYEDEDEDGNKITIHVEPESIFYKIQI